MFKVSLFLMVFSSVSLAGFDGLPSGPRIGGMGGTCTAVTGDIWAAVHNPALLNRAKGWDGSVTCMPGQFGLDELTHVAAGLMTGVGPGGAAISLRSFGFELYRELTVTASVGCPFGPVGAGISVRYYSVAISSYGSASTLGLDAGCTIELINGLTWGCALMNLNSPTIGSSREPVPRSFSSGVAMELFPYGLIAIDYSKEESCVPTLSVGLEYAVLGEWKLRCGLSDVPGLLAAGVGVRLDALSFDYAASFHQELGLTHALSLSLKWGGETP
jgi:hypothetical protein